MWQPRRPLRYVAIAAALVLILHLLYPWGSLQDLDHGGLVFAPTGGQTGMNHLIRSSFNWAKLSPHFPVSSKIPLPTGSPGVKHAIQFNFALETRARAKELNLRRMEIRRVFQKCWRNYRKLAWMKDELTPISGKGKNTFGGWAATLIDSLDTLWMMGLEAEFTEAVDAVATIDWAVTSETAINLFETTIRHLGGLLAAYDLSKEEILLIKAVELGDMLYAGFDTPNRMPGFWVDFEKAKNGGQVADDHLPSASPCSLSLEFTRLSQVTGDPKYYEAITRITRLLDQHQNSTRLPGMWPTFVDMRNENFDRENTFTLGALADSLYEYLPKMYALMGDLDPVYKKLSLFAFETIKQTVLFRPMLPDNRDILFSGNVRIEDNGKVVLDPEGQHLSCFVGGMFALGGRLFGRPDYVDIGARLTRGSIFGYQSFATGIMPEYFHLIPCPTLAPCGWDEEKWKRYGDKKLTKGFKGARGPSYILRPEAIESVFILYRITGDKEFQDNAWTMFQSIQKATETEFGNAAIEDITVTGETTKRDSMESFWLSETLKYFYLIFSSPDLISLDEYVLNTEAHPLRRA